MDLARFPRGVAVGFAIAAPVGPIGVLVIRRTLAEGRLAGFVTGAGAATADASYGALAAFGLTLISGLLLGATHWIRLLGGVFLCYLGLTTMGSAATPRAEEKQRTGLLAAYLSTVALTLTNPATILSFAAVFAGLGLTSTRGNYASAALLVLGVFLGSLLWWSLLSAGMALFRRRISATGLRWINRVSGACILVFGIIALAGSAGALT